MQLCSRLESNRDATNGNEAALPEGDGQRMRLYVSQACKCPYMAVVLAAYSTSIARTARSNTNNGDGAAGETNKDVHILYNDADEAEQSSGRGVARLSCRWSQLGPT